MSVKGGVRPDEGLLMMQELEDRLKEQIDKLEHVRLASAELKDTLAGVGRPPFSSSDGQQHLKVYNSRP